MTTINSYSVSLALDAGSYIRNSQLSRKETSSLIRDINRARSPADNYERSLNRLEKALQEGAIDQRTYNRLLDDASMRYHKASKSAADYQRRIQEQNSVMGSLGKRALAAGAAYVSFGVAIDQVKGSLTLASDAEQAQIAFEVLVKDVDRAKALFDDLRKFSAATPFKQPEIIQAGKQLLAFGFTADEITGKLETLGNISAATGAPIGELAEVVGKMNVQGQIMSEDLNQLAGRGINVFEGLAEQLGTTTDQVKKFASEGKITFGMLDKALTDLATNEFGGMMARQAETAAGKWSTLTDTLDYGKTKMGAVALEANKFLGILDAITEQAAFVNQAFDVSEQLFKGLNAPEPAKLPTTANLPSYAMPRTPSVFRAKPEEERIQEGNLRGLQMIGDSVVGQIQDLGKAFPKEALGEGLLQGVQSLGQWITTVDSVNTEKLIKASTESFGTLEVGSQEAYDFMTDDMTEQFDRQLEAQKESLKRQEAAQKEWTEVGKEGNDLLRDMTAAIRETKVGRLR